MTKVLVADDDPQVLNVLRSIIAKNGFEPRIATSGSQAVSMFMKERPDVALIDMRMPGLDGMQTLREFKKIDQSIPVIIFTEHGDIPQAVEATKMGAYDFISKPPDYEKLMLLIRRAAEHTLLHQKVQALNQEVESSLVFLFGKSPQIKTVIGQVQHVARTDFSLILQGETGTGKSFIARTIHNLSKRSGRPFVAVDIGAIPETLVESELFGHEKGAFTGADRKKIGYFESANGGSIFIDELQNISPHVQSKLLAAVENKQIHPLGSDRPVDLDVRLIAATNADIRSAVLERKFREDLFYRLSEFLITLPPLRERTEDIVFLAEKFLSEAAEDLGKPVQELSGEALALLCTSRWPGNIRELKNVIRRAVLLADGDFIEPHHLHFLLEHKSAEKPQESATKVEGTLPSLSLPELEKMAIRAALDATAGNKTRAAALLDIDYRTLLRKLKSS